MSFNNNNKRERDEQILSDFLYNISGKMKNFETENSRNIKRFKKHMGRVIEDVSEFIEDKTEKVKTAYESSTQEPKEETNYPYRDKKEQERSSANKNEDSFTDFFDLFGSGNKDAKNSVPPQDVFEKLFRMSFDPDAFEKFTKTQEDSKIRENSATVDENVDKAEAEETTAQAQQKNVSNPDAEEIYNELNRKIFNNSRPVYVIDSENCDLMNSVSDLALENNARTLKLTTEDSNENPMQVAKMTLSYFRAFIEKEPGFSIVSIDARNGSMSDLEELAGEISEQSRSKFIYVVITVDGERTKAQVEEKFA